MALEIPIKVYNWIHGNLMLKFQNAPVDDQQGEKGGHDDEPKP